MSTAAASIVGAILGFQASVIGLLVLALSRTRERLARLEQRVEDRNHRDG